MDALFCGLIKEASRLTSSPRNSLPPPLPLTTAILLCPLLFSVCRLSPPIAPLIAVTIAERSGMIVFLLRRPPRRLSIVPYCRVVSLCSKAAGYRPQPIAVVLCSLPSSVRCLSRLVAALVAVAIEERSGEIFLFFLLCRPPC